MKRFIILLLIMCFILTGCNGYTHYPVIIDDTIIKSVPQSVILFDDYTNCNMRALGFGDKQVGDISNFGTSLTPNTEYLVSLDADVLISSSEILSSCENKLLNSGTVVIIIQPATSLDEMIENYVTYYRIMLGNDYAEEAKIKINNYINDQFSYIKSGVTQSPISFIMHEPLFGVTQNTYMEEILKNCGINVLSNGQNWNISSTSNPDIIFCDSNFTFSEIKKSELKNSNAVKHNKIISLDILPFESQSINLFEELRVACLSAYGQDNFSQSIPYLSLSYNEPPEPTLFELIGQFINDLIE